MNDRAFFDTNVLIYGAIKNDPRSERAEELLAVGGVISVQVLNEFVYAARRKFKTPWDDVRVALQWIRLLCPDTFPVTIETHDKAVRIAERYGYRIYDSLIVASALEAKCEVLYSEDLQDGQVVDGRLTIRNPFR
jgi:predicted nucleic acid-binding protein